MKVCDLQCFINISNLFYFQVNVRNQLADYSHYNLTYLGDMSVMKYLTLRWHAFLTKKQWNFHGTNFFIPPNYFHFKFVVVLIGHPVYVFVCLFTFNSMRISLRNVSTCLPLIVFGYNLCRVNGQLFSAYFCLRFFFTGCSISMYVYTHKRCI